MTQLISEQNNESSQVPQSTSHGASHGASQLTPIQPQDVSVKSMSSQVSSWLVPWVYAVGRYLVLPIYFRKVEVIGQEWLPPS